MFFAVSSAMPTLLIHPSTFSSLSQKKAKLIKVLNLGLYQMLDNLLIKFEVLPQRAQSLFTHQIGRWY